MILIDGAEKDNPKLPDYDPGIKCPDHPEAEIADGFGLAGGGFGPYTCCCECCVVLSKTVLPADYEG